MPKTAHKRRPGQPPPSRFRAYTLTALGYAVTDDPHRWRKPRRMSAVTDFQKEFARVNLLLEEALLTLTRAGYSVSEAALEVADRVDVVTATVHARLAVERKARESR